MSHSRRLSLQTMAEVGVLCPNKVVPLDSIAYPNVFYSMIPSRHSHRCKCTYSKSYPPDVKICDNLEDHAHASPLILHVLFRKSLSESENLGAMSFNPEASDPGSGPATLVLGA